jgi:hypothetical protein
MPAQPHCIFVTFPLLWCVKKTGRVEKVGQRQPFFTGGAMSLEPEPDDEVGSEGSGGHLDEIDLLEYEQDPWMDVQDFLYQQQNRVGACKAHGFLLAGKPGAGKTHLAGKLAAELGAVHVGLPQAHILKSALYSAFM